MKCFSNKRDANLKKIISHNMKRKNFSWEFLFVKFFIILKSLIKS